MKKSQSDMRQHIIDVARSLMTQKGYTAVGL
ncbi:MAG: TetR/AcrR family transcriptional regulator, partial [Pantoea sp.]